MARYTWYSYLFRNFNSPPLGNTTPWDSPCLRILGCIKLQQVGWDDVVVWIWSVLYWRLGPRWRYHREVKKRHQFHSYISILIDTEPNDNGKWVLIERHASPGLALESYILVVMYSSWVLFASQLEWGEKAPIAGTSTIVICLATGPQHWSWATMAKSAELRESFLLCWLFQLFCHSDESWLIYNRKEESKCNPLNFLEKEEKGTFHFIKCLQFTSPCTSWGIHTC